MQRLSGSGSGKGKGKDKYKYTKTDTDTSTSPKTEEASLFLEKTEADTDTDSDTDIYTDTQEDVSRNTTEERVPGDTQKHQHQDEVVLQSHTQGLMDTVLEQHIRTTAKAGAPAALSVSASGYDATHGHRFTFADKVRALVQRMLEWYARVWHKCFPRLRWYCLPLPMPLVMVWAMFPFSFPVSHGGAQESDSVTAPVPVPVPLPLPAPVAPKPTPRDYSLLYPLLWLLSGLLNHKLRSKVQEAMSAVPIPVTTGTGIGIGIGPTGGPQPLAVSGVHRQHHGASYKASLLLTINQLNTNPSKKGLEQLFKLIHLQGLSPFFLLLPHTTEPSSERSSFKPTNLLSSCAILT